MKKFLDLSSWSRWSLSLSKGAVIGSIQHVIASTKCVAISLVLLAFLAACDDLSSASAENSEPAALSSAEKQGSSSSSRHCEECNDEAISSNAKVTESAEVTDKSSDSNDEAISSDSNAESNGSSSSSSSEKLSESSSSSAGKAKSSSSSVTLATPCKTETEDNCEYGELKDDRDSQTYKTVKIGAQWWMAENLNYEMENSWCGGGSGETKGDCATYGRLYTWATVIGKSENECGYAHKCNLGAANEQGVCPDGWHVPTYDEWEIFLAAVGGEFTAGRKLKAQNGWKAYDDITNEDTFGFAALPAGGLSYFDDVGFYGAGNNALFWSATQEDENYAYVMNLYFNADFAVLGYLTKDFGFSVRCLQD